MNYTLPKSLDVCGTTYGIRWDFRAALDICAALSAAELDDQERALAALIILYEDFDHMPAEHYAEALQKLIWYLNGGEPENDRKPRRKLMDWEQDFSLIAAPVSRVLGFDVRGAEQLHWWTFLAAYMEIGECTFSHVVGIRAKKAKGQKLTKEERAWYRENQDIVDIHAHYTEDENVLLALWGGGASANKEVNDHGE